MPDQCGIAIRLRVLYLARPNRSCGSGHIGNSNRLLQQIVISDEATVQQRLKALLDAKDITEQKEKYENEIDILYRNKAIYEDELEDYRTTVAFNY